MSGSQQLLLGGKKAEEANYIEDVFQTWLYNGNGSTQTITNGIDLAGKGGLVWLKGRSATSNHSLYDTARGINRRLRSNDTSAENTSTQQLTSFNSNGFDLGVNEFNNSSGLTAASWTFREQPKFFDVVTYTGNDTSQNIAHNLGSVPGCIIIKSTTSAVTWRVYHRSLATGLGAVRLNSDSAAVSSSSFWNSTVPTSTQFTVGSDTSVNAIGQTYVAYLFAHDAGGFGLTGTDNVISCGMATMPAGGGPVTVNLGWEPQWVLMKDINHTGGCQWFIQDNIRGWPAESTSAPDYKYLQAHLSSAEGTSSTNQGITSTGFSINRGFNYADGNTNIIYIAIRRGPMKTPTTGTSVFSPNIATTNIQSGTQLPSAGFPVDLQIGDWRNGAYGAYATDRLRGGASSYTFSTGAENPPYFAFDSMTNVRGTANFESSTNPFVFWQFRRAPSFFDEVCYTGNGAAARNIAHNLGVAPEMIIVKGRTNTQNWPVWATPIAYGANVYLDLTNATAGGNTDVLNYNQTTNTAVPPTATTFTVGTHARVNSSGTNYVAYLFATCPGVSKVGTFSHIGGASTDVNCGFTSGARFVLFKRYDEAGNWFVYDSARGITSGDDPYLFLNNTAAEVANTDFIDPLSSGFQVSPTFGSSSDRGFYIFLAIA